MVSENHVGIEFQNDNKASKESFQFGRIAFGVTGAAAFAIVLVTTPFVTPALRKICLPYVPATEKQVANILQMAKTCRKKGSTMVDLGSGDGRVVIAAAKHGYQAHGYELNQWLVWYSKMQARLQGLHKMATFSRADLWKVKLSSSDIVVIFGVEEMMPQLQEKFCLELKAGAHVLACRFPLTSWKPMAVIKEGIDSVWLYQKSANGLEKN